MSGITEDEAVRKVLGDGVSPLSRLLGGRAGGAKPFTDFPGAGGRFQGVPMAFQAISAQDEQEAAAAAFKALLAFGHPEERVFTPLGDNLLHFEQKVQILARTLRDGTDPRQAFAASPDELRKNLEPDEISALFDRYIAFRNDRSPFLHVHSWEEVEAVIVALGKGIGTTRSLEPYDSDTLRFIVRELAVRWTSATTPNSSGTTSASDSSG